MNTTRRALRLIASFALLIPILACSLLRDEETTSEPQPSATTEAVAEPTEEPAAAEGACSRVAACCRAYVAAMGPSAPPASTCDAYDNIAHMPESACESTMNGYRSGLNALSREVPSECAE